jgi:hypothetical protein
MADVTALREAILEAPLETSNFGEAPQPSTLYVPPAHVKALRLESNLIVGARGVGKSFWTAALVSQELRTLLGSTVRELDRTQVRIGFSVKESVDDYPNADGFAQMLTSEIDPYDIWRAVVIRWLAAKLGEAIPSQRWSETVDWMKENPEDAGRLIRRAYGELEANNQHGLIIFDALDRTSNDWRVMDSIVRGLLRAALWLKSYPRLHAKVFLREDQFERTVIDFPDSSKLLATKAELIWARHDLHGLLWQRLINAPDEHGNLLRKIFCSVVGHLPGGYGRTYQLPDELKRESTPQRALFEALAGPWMGKDKRRGVPYTWSVGHLADGRGQTSPRSFLAAIRQAAEDSKERYVDYPLALHYESIKRGIQKASEIRVNEMAEDFPWVRIFLERLQGLNVPCEYDLVLERWHQAYPDGPAGAQTERLPPQHVERGWDGIRDDLIRLGVVELKKDGRIDMPDLYRVGFGLGRRGGVKPK